MALVQKKLREWQVSFRSNPRAGWLGCLLVAVILAVRFTGLTDYSLDWDECNELAIAKLPLLDLIRVISIRDFHPPAAHILTHFWIHWFGDGDGSVRILYALYGVLGLLGCYQLALFLSKRQNVALLVACLGLFCPFLWQFSHMALHHIFFFMVTVFFWLLFLQLSEAETISFRGAKPWLFFGLGVLVLYSQPIAPLVLLSQLGYLLCFERPAFKRHGRFWVVFSAAMLLLYIPQAWLYMQPWHASKIKEVVAIHLEPTIPTLLLTPANLFWWGDRWLFQPKTPGLLVLLLYGLGGSVLLLMGFFTLKRETPKPAWAVSCMMAFFPLIVLYGVAVGMGQQVFQARAFLFAIFPLLLAVGVWLDSMVRRGRAYQAVIACVLIMALQWLACQQIPLPTPQNDFKQLAAEVKPLYKPGDGFVINRGYLHLGITRYFMPKEFGLTSAEIHMNPQTENVFHMVHRAYGDLFAVSGDDVLFRPDVRHAFAEFQKKHRRIWLFGYPVGVEQLFECNSTFLLKGPGEQPGESQYWQIRCPFADPHHCEAPLVGPKANQWRCSH